MKREEYDREPNYNIMCRKHVIEDVHVIKSCETWQLHVTCTTSGMHDACHTCTLASSACNYGSSTSNNTALC